MGKPQGKLIRYVDAGGKERFRKKHCPNCGLTEVEVRKRYSLAAFLCYPVLMLLAPFTFGFSLIVPFIPMVNWHCSRCGYKYGG